MITVFYDLGVSTIRAESLASSQTAAMLDFREERLLKWGVRGATVQDTCKDLLTKGPGLVRDLEGRLRELISTLESQQRAKSLSPALGPIDLDLDLDLDLDAHVLPAFNIE